MGGMSYRQDKNHKLVASEQLDERRRFPSGKDIQAVEVRYVLVEKCFFLFSPLSPTLSLSSLTSLPTPRSPMPCVMSELYAKVTIVWNTEKDVLRVMSTCKHHSKLYSKVPQKGQSETQASATFQNEYYEFTMILLTDWNRTETDHDVSQRQHHNSESFKEPT